MKPLEPVRPSAALADGIWTRFRNAHLFDYAPAAARLWTLVALLGLAAGAHALWGVLRLPLGELLTVALWLLVVAIAAAFPIQMPPSKQSVTVADLIIFLMLAQHGPAVAVLGAAVDGCAGSILTSKRLSSRVGSPAMNMLGMTLGASFYVWAQAGLLTQGLPMAAAQMASLAAAACTSCAVSTGLMMKMIRMKNGLPLGLRMWFEAASWLGALQLLSATLAGLLSLYALQHGQAALVVGLVVMGLAVVLLRVHLQRKMDEQASQHARVAAAEAEASLNQRRFTSAFSQASIGMAIVNAEGQVLQANQALHQLLAHAEPALLQRPFRSLLHPDDAALTDRDAGDVLARRADSYAIDLRVLAADGHERWVSLHCARFDDLAHHSSGDAGRAAQGPPGLIYQLHDIGQRRRAEDQLRHIAYHDTLTGLVNRHGFGERLRSAVEHRRQDGGFCFAVMMLDLDRFKTVNDNLGHGAGDLLLQEVARRLSAGMRPGDLVARVGGDEFAVLLEHTSAAQAQQRGEGLLRLLDRPVQVHGTELRPRASIGVYAVAQGCPEPDELLRDADLAMYHAKGAGKGRLALYDASLRAELGDKLQLEADLRRAIAAGELTLAYQPLFVLQNQALNGFEALARWTHPSRGVISPAVFVALAEETGCVHEITAWAVDEAVRQHAAWQAECEPHGELLMHVNVSGRDLARPDFVGQVMGALQRHGLPPRQLLLEVTESTLMEQRELSLQTLNQLGRRGVKLGIDDFGTGYSSLAYLSTLPFDCLKIDRSFVTGMGRGPENTEIVRTVVTLGRSLNKQVVAEGIETPEQLALLRELGATIGQGYGLSRPLGVQQVLRLLRHHAAHDHRSPPREFALAARAVAAGRAGPALRSEALCAQPQDAAGTARAEAGACAGQEPGDH